MRTMIGSWRHAAGWLLLLCAGLIPSLAAAVVVTPTIALTGLPVSTIPGTSIAVVATVSSTAGTPTGTVDFHFRDFGDGSTTPVCPAVPIDGSGNASCSFTAPPEKNWDLRASYSGDAANIAVEGSFTFATQRVAVNINLAGLPPVGVAGASISVLATLTSTSPFGPPTGTVDFHFRDFSDGSTTPVCPSAAVVSGVAPCSFTGPPPRNWDLRAFYAGDPANSPIEMSFTFSTVAGVAVTNNNDSGAGSLRDAINTVNASCGAGTGAIYFNIPGSGPHVIGVATELPGITCPFASVDGYTQPGATVNDQPNGGGNDASIQVELDGTACTTCNGLTLLGTDIHVSGLAIHSFGGQGIISAPGSGTNAIHGNYIGTDAGGNARGNQGHGVYVASGFAVIGGMTADLSNLISSNLGAGINAGSGAIHAEGNQVGGKRDGSPGNGNGVAGIYLNRADYQSNVIIYNRVTDNAGAGIVVTPAQVAYVFIGANQSFRNGGIGIDIGNNGATSNDETPPNVEVDGTQNYPVVTSVVQSGGNTIVSGYLKSLNGRNVNIYLYSNGSASPVNEGELPIDAWTTSTDVSGLLIFTRPVFGSWDNVSAQAMLDACNGGCYRSSEYSPMVAVAGPLVVTNTNDSGLGSLRDAINFVNANCAAQTITFNIPGVGPFTIQPSSPLPAITCTGVTIDGYTQPGAVVNVMTIGSNANILVELNGLLAPGNGLDIAAANVTIRGLSITGFSQYGIYVSAAIGLPGVVVAGNFLGVRPDGVSVSGNNIGVGTNGGTGLWVGDGTDQGRNVISGNVEGVALRSGDGSIVYRNYIGTNAAGTAAAPNSKGILVTTTNTVIRNNTISGHNAGGVGIVVAGASSIGIYNNGIGVAGDGVTPLGNTNGIAVSGSFGLVIANNLISANAVDGVNVTSTNGVTIQANIIGSDPSGAGNLGNGNDGIFIAGSSNARIGGLNASEGNLIAFNRNGIVIPGLSVEVSGNSIYLNQQLGINLVGDGNSSVPVNDSCDVDGGGNGLANYPLLTSAQLAGGVLTVSGTHNSTAGTAFRIELFSSPPSDSAANRGGRSYLGFLAAVTDGTCNVAFSGSVVAQPPGYEITATSTDPSGNTSSFSNAVTASAAAPQVSFSVPSIDFGAVLTGTTSASFALSVINTGNAPLNISGAVAPAPFAIASQTCGATLAAATACTYTLVFAPTTPGTLGNSFTLSSNDPVSPTASLGLVGVGMLPPTFALATGTTLTPGQVTTISIRVGNPAANSLAYSNFDVLLTYPPGYANDNPNGSYPQGGCGDPSFVGGSAGGNTIGASGGGSAAPGVTCSRAAMQIIAPPVPGAYTFTIPAGGFTITSPFTYTNPAPITVTANVSIAPAPAVSFSPPSVVFAARNVFTTSAAVPVTLTNSGNAALNITSIFPVGDFTATHNCPASLAASSSCTINVTFTPVVAGSIAGYVQVASDAAGSPHQLALSGSGIALAPMVSLTPGSLTFAARTVSTTSPVQTVTLANTGNGPLAIASIAVSGDFAFASACGASVPAGGSCTIDVTFTPLVAGTRAGAINITDDASGSPHFVPLNGTGLSGIAAVLNVSPGVLDFAAQPVGSDSAPEIVTVSNAGSAPLTFTAIGITGEFVLTTPAGAAPPACPVTLAPGASCRIAVIFRPNGNNLRQGKLTIATNGGTTAITVMGTGVVAEPPQLAVPTSLDFGSQPVGRRSAAQPAALKNVSPYLATITDLAASGDFSVSDTCTTITVGATCSPLVTFQPTAVGPREGALTVRTLRDATAYTIRLLGNGTQNLEAALEVSATQIGYGNAFVGQHVSHEITLRNVGQAVLQVSAILAGGDYFTDGACIDAIAPNASCTVRVTFAPSGSGGRGGQLQILSNAPDSPRFVTLSGTGCFVPSPARARFGALFCGS